ncbi:DUF1499 domain-containing protein [Bartonella quintana]|uniref:DUF1499 domain-containing protein n=3 Tax=Bartonella quintana TaxID=803 RepID=A0A0H3M062_BARQU|nr:DUF1499 domain-containing protein [Bartonella quintana]ETS11720.1 hypothetical protein Q651_01247 [Bartonella quintana BQ2-D70]ETS14527.1 hypothetical protein Q650_01167 [Bartonella quintana JK 73rel]ETS16213.1 hypothetical protein Q649_01175 [Bartonella quintana JK 73]ETS18215.1 hypothetical protein Q647_01163 [Bartonella quintana JK 7]ETS19044.1 hypothetical protein Q648_00752 [Bartonella quintana JK 12]
MEKTYVRLISRAAVWSPRFSGLAFFILLFSILLQRFSMIDVTDFMILIIISACCIIVSLFLAVKAFYNLWVYGALGGMKALRGIIYSLITATPLVLFIRLWFAFPALHDVSTDTRRPPAFFRTIRPIDALPLKSVLIEQAALQMSKWPEMAGRRYDGSPDHIRNSVLNVLEASGWPVVAQREFKGEENEIYIETIAKTFYLGFISDIVIRLTDEGDTTFVDMRSASRYLLRDFGTNAAFIIDFMNALDTEIASLPLSQDDE